jgi:hypothetical protein
MHPSNRFPEREYGFTISFNISRSEDLVVVDCVIVAGSMSQRRERERERDRLVKLDGTRGDRQTDRQTDR